MIIPGDKFRFDIESKGDKKTVHLKGIVDEDSHFAPLLQLGSPLILNLKEITNINSCGIRTWVNFLKEAKKLEVIYEECPPLIVRQLNMVPSFLGHASVLSVYVPYVCDECEKEKWVLTDHNQFDGGKSHLDEIIPCEFCQKGEMELDGHPKQYFAFAG